MAMPLIVVAGPTASGKTALAVELAAALNGEIISADSMQIYQGMSIATAKPSEQEKKGIPHHLIGFLPPECEYSVADYVSDANAAAADIYSRGKQPIIAGGTGLYIRSLLTNTQFQEIQTDEALRAALYEQAQTPQGRMALYRYLQEIDAASAEHIHPNNTVRLVRAVEVYRLTGRTMTALQAESRMAQRLYDPVCLIGLTCHDRKLLYERIDRRVDIMLENGLLEEARAVCAKAKLPTAYQAIGYKEFARYFAGTESLTDAVQRLKQSSRRYAKRQLTWFKREDGISWLYREDYPTEADLTDAALRLIKVTFLEHKIDGK